MKISELLAAVADTAKVQFLHECLLSARTVKKRKDAPTHVRIEFATQNMTPDDLLYWSGQFGRPKSREPGYVGLVVWVPFDQYQALHPETEAAAPHQETP